MTLLCPVSGKPIPDADINPETDLVFSRYTGALYRYSHLTRTEEEQERADRQLLARANSRSQIKHDLGFTRVILRNNQTLPALMMLVVLTPIASLPLLLFASPQLKSAFAAPNTDPAAIAIGVAATLATLALPLITLFFGFASLLGRTELWLRGPESAAMRFIGSVRYKHEPLHIDGDTRVLLSLPRISSSGGWSTAVTLIRKKKQRSIRIPGAKIEGEAAEYIAASIRRHINEMRGTPRTNTGRM